MFPPFSKFNWRILLFMECISVVCTVSATASTNSDLLNTTATSSMLPPTSSGATKSTTRSSNGTEKTSSPRPKTGSNHATQAAKTASEATAEKFDDATQESKSGATRPSEVFGEESQSVETVPTKHAPASGQLESSPEATGCTNCEILYTAEYITTEKASTELKEDIAGIVTTTTSLDGASPSTTTSNNTQQTKTSTAKTDQTTGTTSGTTGASSTPQAAEAGTSKNPSPTEKSTIGIELSTHSTDSSSSSKPAENKVYNTIYDYLLDHPPQTRHQQKMFDIQKGLGEQFRLKWTPDWNKSRLVKMTPKTSWSRTWIDVFSGEEWSYETAETIRYCWDLFVCTFILFALSMFLLWGWDHRHRAFVLDCCKRGTKPMWTRWEDYDLTPIFSWPFGQKSEVSE